MVKPYCTKISKNKKPKSGTIKRKRYKSKSQKKIQDFKEEKIKQIKQIKKNKNIKKKRKKITEQNTSQEN